jgi:NAD(P)-dependent dehydrogenase (short-subunit alcohol dehydrogenase family)
MQVGKLQDKVVIVMGGGQLPGEDVGNGRAAAIVYARNGAQVVVVDKNLDSARQTVSLITQEGGRAWAVRADVTEEVEVTSAIDQTLFRHGAIDILHNNVGINVGDGPVGDLTNTTFDRIMAVNLRGMWLCCRAALPAMGERGAGVIVNIASIAPLMSYPAGAYQMSKAGVLALTRHIAINYAGQGIRANSILPGLVNTPMAVEPQVERSTGTREEVLAARQAKVPLRGAVGTAWDVANAALFLASDDAAFITGAELVVDGGQTLVVG